MSSSFKIPSSCEEGTWDSDRWDDRAHVAWPDGFQKPRTCSFCGSVHADDLLELVKQGWTLEPSTKGYKTYWHPPGFAAYVDQFIGQIETGMVPEKTARYVEPTPPVKLYSNHLTPEQASMLNAFLMINKAKGERT